MRKDGEEDSCPIRLSAEKHTVGLNVDLCESFLILGVSLMLPQSRGGSNSWQNTVAACTRCNNRKANRTPSEAGMTLAWKPGVPTWREAYHRRN